MAITLSAAARNAACDAVVDRVDLGSGPGKIRLKSAADVVLCEVVLAKPAFGNAGAVNPGEAVAAGMPKTGAGLAAAGVGTLATKFDVTDSDNTVIWSGVVGVGAGEIQLDNNSIALNQVITVNSLKHTQPA